jgi:hypothetical protein
MKDVTEGIKILDQTIENDFRHPDYTYVVDLAEKYLKLFTGHNIGDLLKRVNRRESEAEFEQRKALYTSVMPAVANNLSKTFVKPTRSNRVYSSVDPVAENDKKGPEEVMKAASEFWQGESESESGVDAFIRARWFDHVRFDPNAFVAVEFDAFDAATEKAKPFPVEYSSKEAINYFYKNGKLDWLIIQKKIRYKSKDAFTDGHKYILYLEDDAIVYTQVDHDDPQVDVPDPEFVVIGDKKLKFLVSRFQPRAGMVPAIRMGYESDPITNGRTCLSIFWSAVSFFEKEIKAGSELDLSMSLHAFPHKIQYGRRCEGDKAHGKICKDGKTATNELCPICKGSMIAPVHTSGQDVMIIPMPVRSDEPLQDLDKLLIWKTPPIDLIKFQDEYVDKLTEKARKAIFGGTSVTQKTGLHTATEADYAWDDVYDALKPFTGKYSAVWLYFMNLIAVFTDNKEKVKLYHSFPNDPKLKTLGQLHNERKSAKDAGAPQSILDSIDNDILDVQYADDSDTLFKLKVKSQFDPFPGKSSEDVTAIITAGNTTTYLATLYNHFEYVFGQIERKIGDKFWTSNYKIQEPLVKKEVDILIKEIENQKAKKIPIPIEGDEDDPANEPPESK